MNRLFYGDNLDVLRRNVSAESVDLVYLDPPFNSARSYNVIFDRHQTTPNAEAAQIQAFDDTWQWTPATDQQFADYVGGSVPNRVADALSAFRTLLGENDAMAYLVNMAPRLVELYRVLKPHGSLFLHCDPTMSHYLKVLLDSIFGAPHFLSEIIWKRTSAHNRVTRFGPIHDVILSYAKGDKWTWNPQYAPYDQSYIDRDYRRVDPATSVIEFLILHQIGQAAPMSGKGRTKFSASRAIMPQHWPCSRAHRSTSNDGPCRWSTASRTRSKSGTKASMAWPASPWTRVAALGGYLSA